MSQPVASPGGDPAQQQIATYRIPGQGSSKSAEISIVLFSQKTRRNRTDAANLSLARSNSISDQYLLYLR